MEVVVLDATVTVKFGYVVNAADEVGAPDTSAMV
jgi:hypothetical protein